MAETRLTAEIISNNESIVVSGNILSVSFSALDRGNLTDIVDFGIYANNGSISFIDKYNLYNKLKENPLFLKTATVNIFLSKNGTRNQLYSFSTEDYEVEDETGVFTINLISKLLYWQKKEIEEAIFPYYDKTAEELLDIVCSTFNVQIIKDEDFKGRWIYINCPYIPKGNLWEIVTEICKATMSRVYEDANGVAHITSCQQKRNPIVVTPNKILNVSSKNFVSVINSSISYKKIGKFYNESNEQTQREVYFTWDDISNVACSGANLVFTDLMPELAPNSTSYLYATGKAEIKTPYKIYKTGDIKNIETKRKISNDKTEEIIDFNSTFFSLDSVKDDKIILSSFLDKVGVFETNNLSVPYIRTFTDSVSVDVNFYGYEDLGEGILTDKNYKYPNEEFVVIESSDLVRENSYYFFDNKKLYSHILSTIKSRYGNGIGCYKIQCLFGDYYDEKGNLVFDNSTYLSFKKYDVIIPYIIRRGQYVPLETNSDGTPKQFQIVGISYDYKGLLKQTLYVQENKKDAVYDFISYDDLVWTTYQNASEFLWMFTNLEAGQSYKISWSLSNKIFSDEITIKQDANGNYQYFIYDDSESTFTFNGISKDINDALNHSITVEADMNGKINIGFCYINRIITKGEASEFYALINENTNFVIALEEQS